MLNIVDAIIIVLLIIGAALGFKRGVFKETLMFLGTILVFVLAFYLKNPVANFFYSTLPFFDFKLFAGTAMINIILYELIAFLIVSGILYAVLRILIFGTSIFEKILNATIILGIPSKILGLVVGVVQYYFVSFVVLMVLTLQPFYQINEIEEGKTATFMLNNTPVLTDITKDLISSVEEIINLKDTYNNLNTEDFNYASADVLLKNKIISVESVETLLEKNKISINNSEELLEKYREE